MPYAAPDASNPRVRRTRQLILAAARELLAEAGPAALTYSSLAERAFVTRQTLYRHWPVRSALLADLILERGYPFYPEPGADPAVVCAAWLTSLRASLRDPAGRAAILAVTAQSDADPDSAKALALFTADRIARLNDLLKPSGTEIGCGEYARLTGPVLARVFFERAEVSDEFIQDCVAGWLASRSAKDIVTGSS